VKADLVGLAVDLKKQLKQTEDRRRAATSERLLDPEQSYPCPICRQGTIEPITLTEAWGCDRCRQIFERRAESNTIGKLSTPYHRQRNWCWDGKQWILAGQPRKPKAFNAAVTAAFVFFLWTVLSRIDLSELSALFLLGVAAVVLLLVVIFWVLRRR